jgi:hypothetical protein
VERTDEEEGGPDAVVPDVRPWPGSVFREDGVASDPAGTAVGEAPRVHFEPGTLLKRQVRSPRLLVVYLPNSMAPTWDVERPDGARPVGNPGPIEPSMVLYSDQGSSVRSRRCSGHGY